MMMFKGEECLKIDSLFATIHRDFTLRLKIMKNSRLSLLRVPSKSSFLLTHRSFVDVLLTKLTPVFFFFHPSNACAHSFLLIFIFFLVYKYESKARRKEKEESLSTEQNSYTNRKKKMSS